MQDRAKKIVDAALEADANNGKALWYSGVMAIRADDKETAKARWTKLLEQNPPEEIRNIVSQQLTELGVEVPAMAAARRPACAGGGMGGGMSRRRPAPEVRRLRAARSASPFRSTPRSRTR